MDRAEFAEVLTRIRTRPRMWLPDERFTTFIAFVEGADAASKGELLRGFREWLAERYLRHESSVVWWGLVADHIDPNRSDSPQYLGDLDEGASQQLISESFDSLGEFLKQTTC